MRDKLTERGVRAAKCRDGATQQKFSDGGGLYLLVMSDGAKYWRMKYRVAGKEKTIAFGVYPEVTLAEARERRDAARKAVGAGTDPVQQRRAERVAQRVAASNSFEAVARQWLANRARRWSERNTKIVTRRLEENVFPRIGTDAVRDLTGPMLLDVLRRIEKRGAHETAHRVRQYIDAVFRFAVQSHMADANPTPHPEVLTPPTRGRFASVTDPARVGALMRAIRGYHGTEIVKAALELAPLVFVRPGELRAAAWSEFDLDGAEWVIPAERMKMKRPHLVPLSRQAVEILRALEPITRRGAIAKYVFPGERSRQRPMSNNTLLAALRSLGYSNTEMTPHGFRHMASTLLHESRRFRSEVIEAQLAHADRNAIRAVYNAAQYFDERREMMQWWADRLDALAGSGNVVALKVVGG